MLALCLIIFNLSLTQNTTFLPMMFKLVCFVYCCYSYKIKSRQKDMMTMTMWMMMAAASSLPHWWEQTREEGRRSEWRDVRREEGRGKRREKGRQVSQAQPGVTGFRPAFRVAAAHLEPLLHYYSRAALQLQLQSPCCSGTVDVAAAQPELQWHGHVQVAAAQPLLQRHSPCCSITVLVAVV